MPSISSTEGIWTFFEESMRLATGLNSCFDVLISTHVSVYLRGFSILGKVQVLKLQIPVAVGIVTVMFGCQQLRVIGLGEVIVWGWWRIVFLFYAVPQSR